MQSLSLCMIVKNEESFIVPCLESVKHLVSQIIVVDTGSDDKTPELVKNAGATLLRHTWKNNFAEARNVALSHATSDWILMLDADERLTPNGCKALTEKLMVGGFDYLALPLFDAISLETSPNEIDLHPKKFKEPVYLPRVFRRTSDLKWEGAIHESTKTWAKTKARGTVFAPIVHYGNIPSIRETKNKQDRNYQLLRKEQKKRPNDLRIQAYYLAECFRKKKNQQTKQVAERCWALLSKNKKNHGPFLPVITINCWFNIDAGDYASAFAILDQAEKWGINHPHIHWMKAICHEKSADRLAYAEKVDQLRLAVTHYKACFEKTFTQIESEITWGVKTFLSQLAAARVLLKLSEPNVALDMFQLALGECNQVGQNPDIETFRHEAECGQIHCKILLGQHGEVFRLLRRSKNSKDPDILLLKAEALERRSRWPESIELIRDLSSAKDEFRYSFGKLLYLELFALFQVMQKKPAHSPGTMGSVSAAMFSYAFKNESLPFDQERLTRLLPFLEREFGKDFISSLTNKEVSAQSPLLYGYLNDYFHGMAPN